MSLPTNVEFSLPDAAKSGSPGVILACFTFTRPSLDAQIALRLNV
jgi:hypothetical protein